MKNKFDFSFSCKINSIEFHLTFGCVALAFRTDHSAMAFAFDLTLGLDIDLVAYRDVAALVGHAASAVVDAHNDDYRID